MRQTSNTSDDGRSATARAVDIASRITSVSLSLVLPILAGFFVDKWLKTVALFLLVGLALGMTVAGLQLARLVGWLESQSSENRQHERR